MRYYTSTSEILKQRGKKTPEGAHYYNSDERLTPVPAADGSTADIFEYLVACMHELNPGLSEDEIREMWDHYESKKVLILKYLELLREQYTAEGDRWRIKAYSGAVKAIRATKIPIASGEQAIKLKGVGKSIAAKIDEILETGHLKKVDDRLRPEVEKQRIIEEFMGIWGVGPKRANQLYDQGYRDLDELIDAPLSEQETIGLQYYSDFLERIPRSEISAVEPMLRETLKELDPTAKFEICGSYRRGMPTSGDIDIMISSKTTKGLLRKYVTTLHDSGFLVRDLALGNTKYMGVAEMDGRGRRIDIRVLPPENWGVGILYFTGSASFNKEMRAVARTLGLTLSEYGLKTIEGGTLIPTPTEKDVFKALGMKYVPPEKRL